MIATMSPVEVLAPYDIDTYNAMPHIHFCGTQNLEEPVELLKLVITKHNMRHIVGVSRTHKHIDVQDGEGAISRAVNGKEIVTEFKSLTETSRLIPYQFILNENGWMPVAFWDAQAEGGDEIAVQFNKLINAPDFMKDVALTLRSCPLGSTVGLCLRFGDLVKGSETGGLLETTNEDNKVQRFAMPGPTAVNDNLYTTHWHWKEKVEGADDGYCTHCCHGMGCQYSCQH